MEKKTIKIPVKKKIASPAKRERNDNVSVKKEEKKASAFSLPVFDVNGKEKKSVSVPESLFGSVVNKPLIAQAVRVYLANQRVGGAHTKTRGEVQGSTRKIYRQKGTGRARHGGVRAPIFVGGGIAFGPRTHSFAMKLPQKMKRVAMISSISLQYQLKNIKVIDGLETLEKKTKLFANTFKAITDTMHTLLIIDNSKDMFTKAVRNIPTVDIIPVKDIFAYSILSHQKIVFTPSALKKFIEEI